MRITNRVRTAFHEAAHAVADSRLGFVPAVVTIEPSPGFAGHATAVYEDGGTDEERAIALLAGYAADVRLFPRGKRRARLGASSDFDQARDEVGHRRMAAVLAKARAFVARDWPAIERVAAELLEHTRVDGALVDALVATADDGDEAALATFRLLMAGDQAAA